MANTGQPVAGRPAAVRPAAVRPALADNAVSAASSTLLPARVRRWVFTGLGVALAGALYLFAVRGTAIIFDLGSAIGALCF